MRNRFMIIPILALAACGRGGDETNVGAPGTESWAQNLVGNEGHRGFERPDGSFDRADYRRVMVPACAAGMRDGDASMSADVADGFCSCMVDHLIATNSDDELRAMRDDEVAGREYGEATQACGPAASGEAGVMPPQPDSMPGEPSAATPGAARARAPLASLISMGDYPANALRNGEQGRVAFTLDVGADGRVTACRVTESSGSAALDNATCRIMQSRARYMPARNARGVAVAGRDQGAVRWALSD